jgi:hypothetical protein
MQYLRLHWNRQPVARWAASDWVVASVVRAVIQAALAGLAVTVVT